MAINTSSDNYRQTLMRLKKTLLSSRFMRWWLGELASLVPQQMRAATLDAQSLPLVEQHDTAFYLRRFENGQLQAPESMPVQGSDPAIQRARFVAALQKIAGSQRDVALALPASRVLRKTLSLPLATEENLRQVLEFQMEDHTPFPASSLYLGYRILARDFERSQLRVEFVATPREAVDTSIKTLNEWGTTVRAVVAEETLSAGPLLNLLPAAQGKVPLALWQGINPWILGLAAVLALVAMAAPVLIKREAAVQLLPWLDKGKAAAEAADTLKRNLEARVDEHNYLLEKRQLIPPVIMMLEELTRILPDDTWVQQLDIKGKEVQIQGETASSVRLIGLFEQSPMFYDASFRSSLTKGQAAGAERYQLALQIRALTPAPLPSEAVNPAVAAAQRAASAATSSTPVNPQSAASAVQATSAASAAGGKP